MKGKTPAQVAKGQGDQAPALISMQWETSINASIVLVLVERHKLEQDAATALQLALEQNTIHSAQVQVAKLLLHPAPTCAIRLAPTQYCIYSTNTLPALRVVTLVTCAGGLVSSQTGTYTACPDFN